MDNHLTIYWIILSLVLSTKGTIRITSLSVSSNTFNITCQWTDYATNVIFLRQTQTSAYPSAGGMYSRFNSVLQIKKPAFDCQVQSSLPVACICMKDSAVSCIINVTLEEHRIDQWQCGTLLNGEMTFSNITTLTTKEPAKITTFQVNAFEGVSNVTLIENTTAMLTCIAEGYPLPEISLSEDDTLAFGETNVQSESSIRSQINQTLTNVNRRMSGKYTCVASNIHGQSVHSLYLNILFPVGRKITIQDFSNNGNEANIYVGGEVTFSFSALANPLPTSADFTWSKCSDNNICTEIANSSRVRMDTYREMSNLTVANITESDYGIYILKVGNGIGKSHTEVFLLKRLSSPPTEPTTSVSLIPLISAGSSAVLILVIIFVIASVHRHFRRTEAIDVGFPLYLHAASDNNDAIVQPPSVLVDLLDIDCDAIVPSSSLAAENLDFQSEIYSEIDPQLVSEIPSTDDGATNEAQPVTEPSRYESLDPPEQDEESQYVYGRCGR